MLLDGDTNVMRKVHTKLFCNHHSSFSELSAPGWTISSAGLARPGGVVSPKTQTPTSVRFNLPIGFFSDSHFAKEKVRPRYELFEEQLSINSPRLQASHNSAKTSGAVKTSASHALRFVPTLSKIAEAIGPLLRAQGWENR